MKRVLALLLFSIFVLSSCGTSSPATTTPSLPAQPIPSIPEQQIQETLLPNLANTTDSVAEVTPSESIIHDVTLPTFENSSFIQDEGITIYDCDLIQIALPNKYLPQIDVQVTQSEQRAYRSLVRIYEIASLEQSEADLGYSLGFLFGFASIDKDVYSDFVDMSPAGCTIFAEDDAHYYAYVKPTDVQLYRSAGENSDDQKEWNDLAAIGIQVQEDVIMRCGLSPRDTLQFAGNTYPSGNPGEPDYAIIALDCSICNGTGFCTNCIGGQCNDCFGQGNSICIDCVGLAHCGHCGGDGSVYQGVGLAFTKSDCTYCRGSGNCSSCNNTGYISCFSCNGTGYCTICDGLGTCAFCNGTGKIL